MQLLVNGVATVETAEDQATIRLRIDTLIASILEAVFLTVYLPSR